MSEDARIGAELLVVAPHVGHTVTVVGRDKEYAKAYTLRCSCGATTRLGEHWLDRAIARGTLAHGAIAQPDDVLDAPNLLARMEQRGS